MSAWRDGDVHLFSRGAVDSLHSPSPELRERSPVIFKDVDGHRVLVVLELLAEREDDALVLDPQVHLFVQLPVKNGPPASGPG